MHMLCMYAYAYIVLHLDFSVIDSSVFRYYAWDYRVLKTFARHYSTGEIIPEKLVKSMQGARDMFAATELQRQVRLNQWCNKAYFSLMQ